MEFCKIIPFDKIDHIACVTTSGRWEHLADVRARTGADIVINGPIFDMNTHEILQSFVCGGVEQGRPDSLRGFRFDGGEARIAWSGASAPNFISEYGLLVVDGAVHCSVSASKHIRRGRTALGTTISDELVVYVVTDNEKHAAKKTGQQLAEKMKSLGCIQAINLDGGGSSQVADHTGVYTAGRLVPGFICIWLKPGKHKEDETMEVIATQKVNTYDPKGNKESGRYIAKGDVCTITRMITDALLIEVEYPISNGKRTGYVKSLDGFRVV